MLIVQALQAAIDSAGAVGILLLTSALTEREHAGVVASALYALDPLLVRHAVVPGEFALMSVALIAFAYVYATTAATRRAIVAGILLGLAILIRVTALPIVVLVLVIAIADRRPRIAIACAAAALLVISAFAARNYRLAGVLMPSRGRINLFIGNSRYASSLLPAYTPDLLTNYADAALIRERPDLDLPTRGVEYDGDVDAAFTKLALKEMAADPWRTFRLKIRNVWYYFSIAGSDLYDIARNPGHAARRGRGESRAQHFASDRGTDSVRRLVLLGYGVGVCGPMGSTARSAT